MGESMDVSGWVTLIGAVTAAVVAIISALQNRKLSTEVKQVKDGVATGNELSVGQLEAAKETRRITEILVADRTPQESRHMEVD
jgi:exosome complex RNA-binding protein Rrp42 (RNase PH superfamily)